MEWNYKVFDRELLGIICALYHWSHLLRGTVLPILIWTNHRNLTYWIEPHKVGPHTATWQVELMSPALNSDSFSLMPVEMLDQVGMQGKCNEYELGHSMGVCVHQ